MSECLGDCKEDPSKNHLDGVGNSYLHVKCDDAETRHDATEFAVYRGASGRIYIDIWGPGCLETKAHYEFDSTQAQRLSEYLRNH